MKKIILVMSLGLLASASFAQSSQNSKPEHRELPPEVKAAAEECKAKSNGDRKTFGECMEAKGFKRPPHKEGEQRNNQKPAENTK